MYPYHGQDHFIVEVTYLSFLPVYLVRTCDWRCCFIHLCLPRVLAEIWYMTSTQKFELNKYLLNTVWVFKIWANVLNRKMESSLTYFSSHVIALHFSIQNPYLLIPWLLFTASGYQLMEHFIVEVWIALTDASISGYLKGLKKWKLGGRGVSFQVFFFFFAPSGNINRKHILGFTI